MVVVIGFGGILLGQMAETIKINKIKQILHHLCAIIKVIKYKS